jgi:ubiquinone/menaquinone biosynthesis C-methylase UbiE
VDRLTGVEELLDGPLDDRAALESNLRDLRRINRLTGGATLSVRAVRELTAGGGSVLDVGTGSADIPVLLLADARRRGVELEVTATDSRQEVLDAALAVRPALGRVGGLALALADGRGLPWPDGAFDAAHSSMVIHHLEPDEAVAFLRELRRVSRRGIVVNDLARGRLNWVGAWLMTHTVAIGRYTRHDGPLSVRRAYTRREMEGLLREAGLAPSARFVGFAGHRYSIVAR